ncbi:Transmembrane channel-like protein 7 [Lamellibrachia satsuma]|nr:Transmembrane channel-like protein 7 [Lamellibrachia satsuma]
MTTVYPSRQSRLASGSAMYRRRRAHDSRDLVVKQTGISNYALERAQQRGLVLAIDDSDDELDEIETARQVKIIRGMAIPLESKLKLRQRIFLGKAKRRTACCADTKVNCYHWWAKTKSQLRELAEHVTLWRGPLNTVEGLFGGGVLTYFSFLKWLFLLNVYIFILVFAFTAIPQMTLPSENYSTANVTSLSYACNALRAAACSQLYAINDSADASVAQPYIDFLQGTGWMEKTIMFYGAYSDKRVYMSTESYSYNLPLAFLITVLAYFLLSLVLVVRQTAQGVRDKMLNLEQTQIGTQVFTLWDYGLSDDENSAIRHNNIFREIKCDLEEQRSAAERRQRSRMLLWTKRVVINLIVFALLGGAFYLIYLSTAKSIEVLNDAADFQITHRSDYTTMEPFMQLLVQYMSVLTIMALNSVLPTVFAKLTTWEGFSYALEVNATLARTVLLKLASLAVLLFSIYSEIHCTPKDNCNVGTKNCAQMRCWETRVGQEFYKLMLLDFISTIAVVFLVEFPRRIFVTNVNWAIAQTIGLQEFDIPKNILHLIYIQVLVWFGTFFAPLLPAITVLILFVVFYAKMVSVLYNFTPSSKPYRASDSNFFVLIVLMVAYALCAVPIMYVIGRMPPSTGCGPFRSYDYMYGIVNMTIAERPGWIREIVYFLGSAAFGISCIVVLVLIIYYTRKMMNTYKQMNEILREQLLMEGHDKKFLVERLREVSGQNETSPVKKRGMGGGYGYGENGGITVGFPLIS